ncbi:MAG: hypothetical protein WC977_10425 [Anaerovoracaceae bacterium]
MRAQVLLPPNQGSDGNAAATLREDQLRMMERKRYMAALCEALSEEPVPECVKPGRNINPERRRD